MPSEEPEKGDKVSWPWGGGAPGGEVAETKSSGEIAIQSKRGNTIKKNASPDNPAVHVKRSGNDVVKRANELNVEKKASGGGGSKEKGGEKKTAGEKRKKGTEGKEVNGGEKEEQGADGEEEEGGLERNDEGKEVKPDGKKESGKKSGGSAAGANKKQKVNVAKDVKTGEAKKSGSGGSGGKKAKQEKKPSKPREEGGVSARTRSRA